MRVQIRNRASLPRRYSYEGCLDGRRRVEALRKARNVSTAIARRLAADSFETLRSTHYTKDINTKEQT